MYERMQYMHKISRGMATFKLKKKTFNFTSYGVHAQNVYYYTRIAF